MTHEQITRRLTALVSQIETLRRRLDAHPLLNVAPKPKAAREEKPSRLDPGTKIARSQATLLGLPRLVWTIPNVRDRIALLQKKVARRHYEGKAKTVAVARIAEYTRWIERQKGGKKSRKSA
jgi:hypothetical protein